jgi:signal transduction histidine kinase
VVGTLLDITERKRSEEEIKSLNEDLRRHLSELSTANEELRAFSSSYSHDLKTPLVAIQYAADKLLERYRDRLDEKGQRYLEMINTAGKQMSDLINDLLAYFSIGRKEIELTVFGMEEIVADVFDQLKAMDPDRIVDLKLATLPRCKGDRMMIRRVWVNLLHNALKYTRPIESAVIEVGCSAEQEKDVYYVKDNGVGFPSREKTRVFDVFTRLHPADQFEGTGLGLAIVKRAVLRHGGEVWAEADVAKGATFYFSLPRESSREVYPPSR